MTKLRAVVYARVSSADQRDRQTIDSQIRVLPDFVRAQSWDLVRPVGTYVDDGRSASKHFAKRTGFHRLLADMALGEFDVVAVVDMNRITRVDDMEERGRILGAFQRAGVVIAGLDGSRSDLGTFAGQVVSAIQTAQAAHDNKARTETMMRGAVTAAIKGRKPRGATPYGYTYDVRKESSSAPWGVHLERAAIIREIYQRVASGESCQAVGRDLERRKVPTPRRGHWTQSIWRIVANACYRGPWAVDKGRGLVVDLEPLVTDELWFAAQAAVSRSALRGLRRTRHVYLCEGLAVCSLCSSPLWITSSIEGGERVSYYVCQRRRRPDPDGRCLQPFRRTAQVDGAVWAAIADLLSQPLPQLERVLSGRRGAADGDAQTWEQDLAGWRAQLEQLAAAEEAILDRYSRALVSEQAMDRHLKQTASRRALLERQVATARDRSSAARRAGVGAVELAAMLGRIRAALPTMSPVERRDLVRALVSGGGGQVVTVGPDRIEATIALARPVAAGAGHCHGAAVKGLYPAPEQGVIQVTLRVVGR